MSLPEEVLLQLQACRKVLEALNRDSKALLALSLSELPPLERAQAYTAAATLANAQHNLLRLLQGKQPDAASRQEGERITQYSRKLGKPLAALELAASRPSFSLDVAAANRFIDAAIPDLTPGQKQQLKEAGKRAGAAAQSEAAATKRPRHSKQELSQTRSGSGPTRDRALQFLAEVHEEAHKQAAETRCQSAGSSSESDADAAEPPA